MLVVLSVKGHSSRRPSYTTLPMWDDGSDAEDLLNFNDILARTILASGITKL
jgi:hypothetical protein